MKLHYFEYCFADRIFYDLPEKWSRNSRPYKQSETVAPAGWKTYSKGPWFGYVREDKAMRPQGWKVHVSASKMSAQQVLDITHEYCIDQNIPFKFLSSEADFIARNLKYTDRGGSGKFITIYPDSDEQLEQLLNDLDPKLQGHGGAYILNDLRWKEGPLYVRYGGFVERHTHDDGGEPALAIEDPNGALVIDRREPTFTLPDWVEAPAFLRSHIDARLNTEAPEDFPYVIESALHFSNGGGVYKAREKATDRTVVLKEARPHAGLDQLGRDAVSRLKREYEFLTKLTDVDGVVQAIDYFELWEHHFLVQEYVEGIPLNKRMTMGTPLIKNSPTEESVREYTEWALGVCDQIGSLIGELHSRGIAFGDLHPNNIMVDEDDEIRIIDFELATYADQERRLGMGAPGYVPPDQRDSLQTDLYALACIKLAAFLPITVLFSLDTTKAELLVAYAERRFPLPEGWGAKVLEQLDLGDSPWAGTASQMRRTKALVEGGVNGPDWARIEASMARAVWQSATPHRDDRLFPGDVNQFEMGGLGFAYGAAGVLYAMAVNGHGRREEYESWLLNHVRDQESPHRLGFFDGLHGVAHAFEEIGNREAALEVLEIADDLGPIQLGDSLLSGWSGVALNQAFFAHRLGDQELLERAVDTAEQIARRMSQNPPSPKDSNGRHRRAGLLHGLSGSALLFVRLHELTGQDHYLDRAEQAIRHELECCQYVEDQDVLYVDEGWRSMPYIEVGSTGVALPLTELLRHRQDEELMTAFQRLRRVTNAEFHICPILFQGTAGQMGFLGHTRGLETASEEWLERSIEQKRNSLRLHLVGVRGELGVPGDQLMRVSMDFGTGTAGILHALGTLRDPSLPLLPFLKPFTASGAVDT